MKTFLVNLTLFLFIAVSVFVPEPSASQHKGNIDQKATERLKQMSDYLGDVKQFTVNTQNTLEDLLESGHRVDLDVFAKVIISRPNKIRAERRGDLVDQIFYYNGKTMTLFNPPQNVYSTEEAPDTFHGLFKFLYESLGFRQLDPEKLPRDVGEIIYQFDPEAARWRLNTAFVNEKKFVFAKNGWKIVT